MGSRRSLPVGLGGVALLLILGMAAPVIASPAPVTGCPPCSTGFTRGAATHGLDTEVQHGEATVQVHENGSATWTVQVVPTNETVLTHLATNRSLARAVATDSFGTRYGPGITHELISTEVTDGAFVMRYRTLDIVQKGPLGTRVLTYFRDSPGAYVYTDLGADELTVVAPREMTIARGFGDVAGDRMTATELPDVQDGPFVVFTPVGHPAPGLLGTLAVVAALWGVIARNLVYFVVLPGGVLIGGFAGIRRFLDATTNWDPTHLGSFVAASGTVLLIGTILWESEVLPGMTGNLLVGGGGGAVLLALGVSVAVSGVRRHLAGWRIVGAGIALGIGAAIITGRLIGTSGFHRSLSLAAALLPVAVGLGWVDAQATAGDSPRSNRHFIGLAVGIVGVLVMSAPLRALGGTLFFLGSILLTVAAVGIVIVAIPLYLLGAAGANAERP